MSVSQTELTTGVGSTEPATSGGAGFAGAGSGLMSVGSTDPTRGTGSAEAE